MPSLDQNNQLTFQWLIQQDQKKRQLTEQQKQFLRIQEYLPACCRAAGWWIENTHVPRSRGFRAENYTYPMRTEELSLNLSDIAESVLHASFFYEILPHADLLYWGDVRPDFLRTYPKNILVKYNGVYRSPRWIPPRFYFTDKSEPAPIHFIAKSNAQITNYNYLRFDQPPIRLTFTRAEDGLVDLTVERNYNHAHHSLHNP